MELVLVTGTQVFVLWLLGLVLGFGTVASVGKAFAQARVEVAERHLRAQVEAHRVVAEVRGGVLYPPPDMAHRDDLGGGL